MFLAGRYGVCLVRFAGRVPCVRMSLVTVRWRKEVRVCMLTSTNAVDSIADV